ncbi:hypothetical protein ACJVDH_05900 [Pedobacter sp. AW1-32]|uniref:hypothetical protein n=1 Tax=Pedobacter sp. AW1-32 TaxID=3383026 RepID=UPI003FED8AE7
MTKTSTLTILILLSPLLSLAQTEVRDNASLQGNAGAKSGFFETSNPTNYPGGAASWWHLLDVRHSNTVNNYAMQFSGSFFDQNLFFRKTNDNASQEWSKVLLQTYGKAIVDGQGWFSYGNPNMGGYSWTNAALTTNSIEIVNNNQTVSNSSPTLAFHRYGSGGPQFRLAADGSNILYLESSGENSARSPLQYGGGPNNYFNKLYVDAGLVATGNVGIGTTSLTEKLNVEGKIRAREVRVESANWPDYVFKPEYALLSLADIEKQIKQNGHLPEMPSAAEVETNGIALGEINKLLLKKIEELTLHLILKDKQLNSQQEELNLMKSTLSKQQQLLENIQKQLK